MMTKLPTGVLRLIDLALEEDLGRGDVTTESIFAESSRRKANVVAREPLVVAGLDVAAEVFKRLGANMEVLEPDGTHVEAGTSIADVGGPVIAVLGAERTALNFLQRLCGVATMASEFAKAVEGTGARVVDTRKTTPGYRWLEKMAVRAGGMHNHRADLASGILIKDNHIAAAGSVKAAVEKVREFSPHSLRVEVEVDNAEQLGAALEAGVEIVLLDNMSPEQVRQAALLAKEAGVMVEVSGGITLDTVREYAEAGADVISVGAVTHSVRSVDIGLDA